MIGYRTERCGQRNQRVTWIAVLLLAAFGAVTFQPGQTLAQATPVTDGTVAFSGAFANPAELSVADLQALGSTTVDVTYQASGDEQQHSFTGVPLITVIESLGLQVDPETRNPLLSHYLVVTASDGYVLAISGGELDPNFGNSPMLLAWEMDGQPLSAEDGPVRLVVPGDTRGGRYVYGIVSIELVNLTATPGTPAAA